jgi:hypothetical protein
VGAYIINRESRVLQLGSRAIIFAKTELKPANQKKICKYCARHVSSALPRKQLFVDFPREKIFIIALSRK